MKVVRLRNKEICEQFSYCSPTIFSNFHFHCITYIKPFKTSKRNSSKFNTFFKALNLQRTKWLAGMLHPYTSFVPCSFLILYQWGFGHLNQSHGFINIFFLYYIWQSKTSLECGAIKHSYNNNNNNNNNSLFIYHLFFPLS